MVDVQIHYRHGETVIIRTEQELVEFIDRVSAASAAQPVPSMVEFSRADDPYGHQIVEAGLGAERGFVRFHGKGEYRTTVGNDAAVDQVVYDYMNNATEIPAREEVQLSIVRKILMTYLETGANVPADVPELEAGD